MNKILLTSAILLAAASVTACQTNATDLPEGKYEKSTVTKDSSGTKYTTDTETDVDVDSNGRKTATTTTKTTKDPKGLFNKSSTESTTTVKE